MFRRILAFLLFIGLIAAVSFLVYFNAQETEFWLTPRHHYRLPLGVLMLAAAIAGAVVMFLLALMREGRHALREWRVHRELRAAERTAEYHTEARSLVLSGDYKRARLLLAKATQKRDPDVSDIVDYAETFLLEGDAGQARRVLEDGQKQFGNEPLMLHALARACRATGDTPAAVSTLERAVRVCPSSLSMLSMLRDLLFETGSWTRACEIQQRVSALRPADATERNRLAGARLEAARRAPGELRGSALRTLTTEHPDFAPALIERARFLEAAGDRKRAVRVLEKAAKRHPRPVLLEELERLVPDERRIKLAKLYGKLVTGNPGNSALRLRAARYLISNRRFEEAEQLLRGLSANGDGASGYVHALWAEIHEARSEPERAQQEYRQAISAQKPARMLACAACGGASTGWRERCPRCGAWDTFDGV